MITLQRWREQGVYALTAEGVYPTQTLPAHATMLTGRLPVDHRVTADQSFDETRGQVIAENLDNIQSLKGDSLLSLLEKEKLTVGAIGFPLTAGAALQTNHAFAIVTNPLTRKPKDSLAAALTRDQAVLAKARETISQQPPQLLLVYFNSLDVAQQLFGITSNEAAHAKRTIDNALQQLHDAYEKSGALAETTFLVVSDHGALRAEESFAPNVLLAEKGWLTTDKKGQITNWRALVEPLGGSAMVFVKNPKDENDVLALFRETHQKPDSPIWRVITRQEAAKLGADERAALFLDAAPGSVFSERSKGGLIEAVMNRASHGHLPSRGEMRIGFVMTGKGVRPNAKLNYARLTDVAPTIARLLGLELRATRGRVLGEVLKLQ